MTLAKKVKNKPFCIIMARGDSKRIPRKNSRFFCGLPMIAWVARAAYSSNLFDSVIISTEDTEIAEIAIQYGCTQPFIRPKNLADEFASTASVLKHALETLQAQGQHLPDHCCCLYGTSAMVTAEVLSKGYTTLKNTSSEFVMAVAEYVHPIERSLQFDDVGRIYYRQPEFVDVRTQDIKPSYHDVGLFYWFSIAAFLQHGGLNFLPLIKAAIAVPRNVAVDIDKEEDWAIAELLAAPSLKIHD